MGYVLGFCYGLVIVHYCVNLVEESSQNKQKMSQNKEERPKNEEKIAKYEDCGLSENLEEKGRKKSTNS